MIREIERTPNFPSNIEDFKAKLTRICFRKDNVQPADLIFVFGTNICHNIPACIITDMLNQSISSRVLITGGIAAYEKTSSSNIPECELIQSLIDLPINKKVEIILEKMSKNNLENVLYASELFDFSKIESIICLSHSYASGRSVQTLRRIFNKTIYSLPYDVSFSEGIIISENNWWFTEHGKALVWGEYLRLKKYGLRGDFKLSDKMMSVISEIDSLATL